MPRVIEIVKAHLIARGFSGLVAEDASCGCELDDLVPCGNDCSGCRAGYKHKDPRSEYPHGWAIWEQKEPPSDEQWSNVDY
jgi:hypothetical protein